MLEKKNLIILFVRQAIQKLLRQKKYFLPKIKLLFVCNKNAFRGNIFVGNISRPT